MIRNFFIYLAIMFAGILFFASMVLFAIPALQESTLYYLGLHKVTMAVAMALLTGQLLKKTLVNFRLNWINLHPQKHI